MKGHRWFAATYDFLSGWEEQRLLRPLRQRVIGQASGRVLEIGAGTGASFPYYRTVDRLVAAEPDPFMLPRARRRARDLGLDVELVQCVAEELSVADASFDTVISTLVLCTVSDQARSLSEIKRVLKPAGTLRFIEHVRFEDLRGDVQDRVTPVWSFVGAGCHPNRRTADSIEAAGFELVELERRETPVMPLIIGVARPHRSAG
jgi:ubiquinone/menaquinone biosynthesis C-methylase UbiE